MKKILSLGMVFAFVLASCFAFVGCGTETINLNVVEEAQSKAETLIETFYNKPENSELATAGIENFYVEIGSDFNSDVEVVSINGTGHTANENVKYSVGNNNFVETPAWIKTDGKLYVAVPTLYVEARSGVTTVVAGSTEFKVTVFENAGTLNLDSVSIVGPTDGAEAEKTTNDAGKIVVNHTRTSGKTAVAWVLSSEETVLPAGLYVFTKKIASNNAKVSYGVDVTENVSSKGYTSALYNYWLNGNIAEPVNRTIDYTVAVPGYGNINFDINITEVVPEN